MADLAVTCGHSKTRTQASLWSRIHSALALIRQRRALAKLSKEELRDIGISRSEADTEASRPFWDAPDNWFR